ncbi:MAG TPA: hypothetical protein VM364_12175 [Vicinamibacterales bacterium]|nr:hypothetical protein [Vicinamibacterales bacterium]
MATKTRIVRIGNSRGIRVPKVLLEEAGLRHQQLPLALSGMASGGECRMNELP